MRDECGGSPVRLARVLLEIAESPKAHNRDRVAATRELLDRGWGKAPAFAAMEADDPLELSEIAREIQQIADELAARREASPSTEATALARFAARFGCRLLASAVPDAGVRSA